MHLLLFNLATDVDDPVLGFTTRWITALARRVSSVHVISMRVGRFDLPSNVHVYSVGKEKGYSEPQRLYEFYRNLRYVLRTQRIDRCFSHMMPLFSTLAAPLLKAKKIPIVTWYAHTTVTPIVKMAYHVSTNTVSPNDTSYPYRRDKLITTGHGIAAEWFANPDITPDEPPLVLCAGRLSPRKDNGTLIDAMHRLTSEGRDIKCAFVGEPPARDVRYAAGLFERVRQLGIEDRVQFVGAVPNYALAAWYHRCTVHVNLAATGALDKAPLEAMACSRPTLVANKGFEATLGEYGPQLVFEYGNSSDLAAKLRQVLRATPVDRELMAGALRRAVLEQHGLERLADRLCELLASTGQRS